MHRLLQADVYQQIVLTALATAITDESQRQQQAKMAIENFINQVNNIHLKQVQGSGDKAFKEEKTEQAQSTESNKG
jgi:D-mannonate dehydratase